MIFLLNLTCISILILLVVASASGAAEGYENGKLPTGDDNEAARIRNGEIIDASDPEGNVAVFVSFPEGGGCTATMANNEWVVIAAHCIVNVKKDDPVLLFYTNTTGSGFLTDNTTVAEIFLHPGYKADRWSILPGGALLLYGREAATDFGMFRLEEPAETCEARFNCTGADRDVPMNAVFAYAETTGFFHRRDFVNTGYGVTTQRTNEGISNIRKGTVRVFSRSRFGGTFWQQRWRNRIFGEDPARACSGDSGSPLVMETTDSPLIGYSVVGVLSGGGTCDQFFGSKYYFRLVEETADMISARVSSSGGSCERFVASDESKLMHCAN